MSGQQLLPFRSGTRQRLVLAGTGQYAFTIGTTTNINIPLPNVGEAAMLILKLRGTVTYSAGGAFAIYGPWSMVQNATVSTNLGSATLWNMSGYGSYLAQGWQKEGWRPDFAGMGSTTPDPNVFVFPLSGTGVAWELSYVIMLSLNDGLNFELGLLNMQSPQVQANLNLTLGTAAQIATNITACSGIAECWYWYYDIGDPSQFALPPLTLVRSLEDISASVAATGDNYITIPQLGVITNITQYLTLNSILSDAWAQTSLVINKTDTPYVFEKQVQKTLSRRRDGLNPIVGVADWDFLSAYGPKNMGDFRDAWDSEAFATIDLHVLIPTGTTLAAGDTHKIVRRCVQMLQASPAQQAA
jgi:hypothetical protein